ncbi:MAG: sugar ABC transporter substrate-binding protein [Anaerolineae bacterium]
MTGKKLSRREFLRAAAASAAGAAALSAAPALGEGFARPPRQEQITLTVAHAWETAFMPHQEEWDAQFMAANPDIKLSDINNTWGDHQTIVPTWAAAGQLPDVLYVHGSRAFPWSKEGLLINIQSYAEADEEFDVGGIWEEALRLYRYEGNLHAIPYDHGPVILGYNKTLFDAEGVDYPAEDWTMDDLREAALKFTKPGEQWGYSGYYGQIQLGNETGGAHLGPWGAALFNEKEDGLLIDSDEARAALNFWFDMMHKDHAVANQAESDSFPGGIWLSGQVAMFGLATWGAPQMHESADFEWDVAPWPEGPAGRRTGSFGSGYGITRDSKNPDAGWRYLSAYLSVEGMEFMWGKSGRGSPAREAAYQSYLDSEIAPEHGQYFLDALKNYAVTGRPYESVTGPQVMDVVNQNSTLLATGDITVDQFISNVMEQTEPIFAQSS